LPLLAFLARHLRHARTGPDGLDEAEVEARRADYGPNSITEAARVTLPQRIWAQVNNALIWILIASAVVSAGLRCVERRGDGAAMAASFAGDCVTRHGTLRRSRNGLIVHARRSPRRLDSSGVRAPCVLRAISAPRRRRRYREWADLALIGGVIVLNVGIGLAQEAKAERASLAIRAMLSSNAMVVRQQQLGQQGGRTDGASGGGGARRTLPAAELVPGDVIVLAAGDRVPADVRLVSVSNLQVRRALRRAMWRCR
jgi:magnesium-transporting ATPase (P-type)